MPFKFNPFSGNFDQTGSGGGGSSYIDGEVATYNDLPLDGTAALNSAWLVRTASGVWPVSRKQAGIYIRTATAGSSRDADYTYAGTMPDVFSDAVLTIYDEASTTRTGQFNLGSVTAGQNRVLTWPDANGTITLNGHTHSASEITSGLAAIATSGSASDLTSGTVNIARIPSGVVTGVDATTADVLSISGSNLVADDGGLIDSSNPALVWDDAAGKAVWANPLRRTSAGAFYVGVAPTTTALGTNAINIQPERTNATFVAGGTNTVAIGRDARTANSEGVAIGNNTLAGSSCVAIGTGAQTFTNPSGGIAIGRSSSASGIAYPIAIGGFSFATAENSIAIGGNCDATAVRAIGLGQNADISLRAGFMTLPFGSVYWGGQTTNNTATILTLDASGTASDRFTIAANTALAVDILLVARRATTQDKWLVARRFLGIRRDGSNNTALIGSVQTLGTDQSAGSPTWTFALTADDTNEALQLEVTGATGETVEWRATAFYRVA